MSDRYLSAIVFRFGRRIAPLPCTFALLAPAIVAAGFSSQLQAAGPAPRRSLADRIATLETSVAVEESVVQIEKLTRAYGYYVDKQLWDQVVDLFTDQCVVEIAGRGVYRGKVGADKIFRQVMGRSQIGLRPGALFNHMILQGIVDVAPGGHTAQGRWRAMVQMGQSGQAAIWSEGTYENDYVQDAGVWKIARLKFFATFYAPYDKGWGQAAFPNNGPSATVPPDAPQSVAYDVYPGHYVPPFHYPNPVTGRVWTEADTQRYSESASVSTRAAP